MGSTGMGDERRIRVLIVDDSAVVRRMLSDELRKHADIEVVGAAADPYEARGLIAQLKPDVLTLDVEMPRMDGITFLGKVMRHYPMPVVMISSVTPRGGELAMKALALGAVEVMSKDGSAYRAPTVGVADAVRRASKAVVQRLGLLDSDRNAPSSLAQHRASISPQSSKPSTVVPAQRRLIAIGASTGGPRAVEEVLRGLPTDSPPVVLVQHMPANFTGAFASRLNEQCALRVSEAKHGQHVAFGEAVVAPGGRHLLVSRDAGGVVVHLSDAPPVNFHRPSVDVLFESVARHFGSDVVAVMLTGMGADGAKSMRSVRDAGAHTIGQDEATSVVYGMPRAAAEAGAVIEVRPLGRIAEAIRHACGLRNAA